MCICISLPNLHNTMFGLNIMCYVVLLYYRVLSQNHSYTDIIQVHNVLIKQINNLIDSYTDARKTFIDFDKITISFSRKAYSWRV